MKNYKIGDTIYIKDQIVAINIDDTISAYRGGYNGWLSNRTIIDELPTAEPVKPVLPKDVADELEDAKNNVLSFIGYMNTAIDNDYCETNIFAFGEGANANKMIKVLSDAWYNGYTIEQVPRYMVYVTGTNKQFMYLKRGGWAKVDNKKTTPITPQSIGNYITAGGNRDLYWFTDEEINRFNLQDCEKELVADD